MVRDRAFMWIPDVVREAGPGAGRGGSADDTDSQYVGVVCAGCSVRRTPCDFHSHCFSFFTGKAERIGIGQAGSRANRHWAKASAANTPAERSHRRDSGRRAVVLVGCPFIYVARTGTFERPQRLGAMDGAYSVTACTRGHLLSQRWGKGAKV